MCCESVFLRIAARECSVKHCNRDKVVPSIIQWDTREWNSVNVPHQLSLMIDDVISSQFEMIDILVLRCRIKKYWIQSVKL